MLPVNSQEEFPPPSRRHIAEQVALANHYVHAGSLAAAEAGGAIAPAFQFYGVGTVPLFGGRFERLDGGDGLTRRRAVTVPIAREIVQFSSGLLFSDPPLFNAGSEEGQAWVDMITRETDLLATLVTGAEQCAANGGVFIRPVYRGNLGAPKMPGVTLVRPDYAIPLWDCGELQQVLFYRPLSAQPNDFGYHGQKSRVWRLLEHHFVMDGVCLVEYALYESKSERKIGERVPLEMHHETVHLSVLPDSPMTPGAKVMELPLDVLDVVYVANLPRMVSDGSPEGRSDLSGITDILELADTIMSGIAEEVELGRPRMMVDPEAVESDGDGNPVFPIDQRILFPLSGSGAGNDGSGEMAAPARQLQWSLRSKDHIDYFNLCRLNGVAQAGYSPASFGYNLASQRDTGPSIRERKDATFRMRATKRRLWGRKLEMLMSILVRLAGGPAERTNVVWRADVETTEQERAQIAATDGRNQTLSVYEITRQRRPDWSHNDIIQDIRRRGIGVTDDGFLTVEPVDNPEGVREFSDG